MHNLYEIIGVNQNASQEEIKLAYKKKLLQYHPDKQQFSIDQGNNQEINFHNLHAAWEVLRDPQKRKLYDIKSDGKLIFCVFCNDFY